MAFVAETMGARQVELPDMAGEYTKGVTDAAAIAAARAKQEQIGLELENARLKQDQMKASIFLNSMNGIANAPNPAVKKILQKQAEQQISKMYGIQPNSDTMTALIASPDFASTIQDLMDNIGLTGMGRAYVDGINKYASRTNQPYLDYMKTLKEGFEMMLEEKKAKAAADATAARAAAADRRLTIAEERLDLATNKEESAALRRAEEDKQYNDYKTQLLGAGKGLNILEKGIKAYRDSAGQKTIKYSELTELLTDLAQLTQVKPSAVVPVSRQKELGVDIPQFNKLASELVREIKVAPAQDVPISLLTGYKDQFEKMAKYLDIAAENELDTGLRREISSGTVGEAKAMAHKSQALEKLRTQRIDALVQSGIYDQKTPQQMIEAGASYQAVKSVIDANPRLRPEDKQRFTKDLYNSVKSKMKKQGSAGGK